jgi:chaperonin GroES
VNIKPLDDRVLIEQIEEDEQKVGTIIIPDSAKEKPRMGNVVAVGTDEDLQENIKVGDKIIYSKYSGDEISVDDKDYLIIQRGDILAIVN